MGKKMNLSFPIFRIRSFSPKTCAYPKTLSFRAPQDNNIFKTMSSAYVQDNNNIESGERQHQALENTVTRGLTSQRLIFKSCPLRISDDLGKTTLQEKEEEPKNINHHHVDHEFVLLEGSLAMAMDSREPFEDFRRSMEEMVDANEMKRWDCLEKMLTCYLKVNSKSNHGYIVGAFVDLVVGIALDSSSGLLPFQSSSSTTFAITAADSLSSPVSPSSCSNFLSQISSSDLDE